MYRLEVVLILLAAMPFTMACIYASAVAPRRKQNMQVSLLAAAVAPVPDAFAPRQQETTATINQGAQRVARDFQSLYSSRLLLPAFLLSVLYGLGFSLGLSVLLPEGKHGLLLWPFTAFGPTHAALLSGPAFAVVGAYTFNSGVLVRRAFMADFSKNVMWSCINRLILSVGFAVFLHTASIQGVPYDNAPYSATRNALCFAVAFFPSVFITAMRKRTRKLLGVGNDTQELDIQLIQGIDVWKEERLSEEGVESVQNMATADIFGLLPKVHYPLRTIVDWMDQAIFIQRFPFAYQKWQQAGFPISAIRFAAIVDPSMTGAAAKPDAETLAAVRPSHAQPAPPFDPVTPAAANLSAPSSVTLHAAPEANGTHTGSTDVYSQATAGVTAGPQTAPIEPSGLYTQSSIITGQPAPDIALLQSLSTTAAIELPVLREALTSLSNDAAVLVLARLWQSGAVLE